MKYAIFLTAFLSLAACGGEAVDNGAPSLSSYQGQWVVINYWARWCKPCIEEIPELNKLDSDFAAITVLGVNYDGASGEELRTQAEDLGVAFRQLEHDPAAELGVRRPVVLPTTLIVAPDGTHHSTLVGPQTVHSLAAATGLAPTGAE
ncbi:MAG: TlpA family protein disulfide reductase [Halioglobus sp.]|nr:TlpA family protein disulfide reductase [Halioglobus sp.]